ncbi:MAG: epoxyqueuosine reductase QueH [Bacteroidales bacterium]|nr:epoxyqueuosine reductase QueH [Bacteroidales bacterium]MDD7724240.1 epoxyqueuosine reductase QueH [Bacteroidales bacterium]
MKHPSLTPPPAEPVMLHACCAPCSSAIVEWMLANGVKPTVYYYNPNIFPYEEYAHRRDESRRHAESQGLAWVEGPYDHEAWLAEVRGLEDEPERGSRCLRCFTMRLRHAAEAAKQMGCQCLTTTLASSRWKSQAQIDEAGATAEAETGVTFWHQNWRKDGLSERRAALLREFCFYNQLYCGCEFSMNNKASQEKESR